MGEWSPAFVEPLKQYELLNTESKLGQGVKQHPESDDILVKKYKTAQEHEETSEPVLLQRNIYWKKIRKKNIPRTQIGPRKEDIVYLKKKTENTRSEWKNVPLLKRTSHRKATKKKICVKKTKTNSASMVTKLSIENESQLLRQCYITIWTATFAVLTNLIILIKNWDTFKTKPPNKVVLTNYIMANGRNPQKILKI